MAGEAANPDFEGRRYDRLPFDGTVQFRTGNRRAAVQVRDISPLGAKISGVFLVQKGDRFWLKLPMIEALEAQVAWFTDFEFGCEFIRPLSPLVFESIVGPN
ncbi:MAG: PilZ domain-containing protein [Novosphingobium sp.]|uniref:PilZ domain-containing protein n=1 Tax=Novosphingobium sp. TaxID=1874826 RepID=UPI0018598542|nr:PilZ domain-containing protein [Novosphingobium sp.]